MKPKNDKKRDKNIMISRIFFGFIPKFNSLWCRCSRPGLKGIIPLRALDVITAMQSTRGIDTNHKAVTGLM